MEDIKTLSAQSPSHKWPSFSRTSLSSENQRIELQKSSIIEVSLSKYCSDSCVHQDLRWASLIILTIWIRSRNRATSGRINQIKSQIRSMWCRGGLWCNWWRHRSEVKLRFPSKRILTCQDNSDGLTAATANHCSSAAAVSRHTSHKSFCFF